MAIEGLYGRGANTDQIDGFFGRGLFLDSESGGVGPAKKRNMPMLAMGLVRASMRGFRSILFLLMGA